MTGIISVFVLLPVFDSEHVHETDTLLVSGDDVLDATLTTSTRVATWFTPIVVVLEQVTVCPLAEQLQLGVFKLTNVSPAGSVSVIVTGPFVDPTPELDTEITIPSPLSFTVKLDGE
jgi:hypothetical protein